MSVFMATAGRFSEGDATERIRHCLRALPGRTMAELLHLTGLGWDEAYPIVVRDLKAKKLQANATAPHRSQGELVSGAVRYMLRDAVHNGGGWR